MLWDSEHPQLALLSTGSLSYQTLQAASALAKKGVDSVVLHLPTIKPLDTEAVLMAAKRVGRVVTVEEHQAAGGFGSAVTEFLAEHHPVPIKILGVRDQFGQSGTPEELLAHYGLDARSIEAAAQAFVAPKV